MVVTQQSHTQIVEKIQQEWEKQGIRYVIFELADMSGMPRSKVIPLKQWRHYAVNGLRMIGVTVAVDSGSNIVPETSYSEARNYGDAILIPDLTTAQIVPWYPHTARVICDPHWPDGTPLDAAPRNILRKVLNHITEAGYAAQLALEYEFHLLKDAESREPVFTTPHIFHNARNFAVPAIASMIDMLSDTGIEILTLNCEYGNGQYEITYAPQRGLAAGDQGFTFKQGVKAVAQEHGYHATFMTKPYPESSASGAHLHLSLVNEGGENVFLDTEDELGISDVAYYFTQGMIKHTPATMALVAPSPNCFQRFVEHSFAPVNLSWGIDDRSALIRVKNSRDAGTHLENRLPTALSNPYLAIAAVLASGLLGIKEGHRPPALSHEPAGESHAFAPLPKTLDEALDALEADGELRSLLGEEFTEIFIRAKRQELARQTDFVQQRVQAAELEWQMQEYLKDY